MLLLKQGTLMHFQFQFTILVFLLPPSHPINSNARTSTAFTLSTASTERESIDRAIHFKTMEESARQRHFEEWQTEKPSEIDRGLSMSRLYRRPYIIMPISRLWDLETLSFFFSGCIDTREILGLEITNSIRKTQRRRNKTQFPLTRRVYKKDLIV